MKRLRLILILFFSISFTGCVQKNQVLNDEVKSNAVAEYIAGLLLKYDKNYDQELAPEDATGSIIDEKKSSAMNDSNEQITVNEVQKDSVNKSGTQNDHTLSEVIGTSSFLVNYNSYKLLDTYPDASEKANFTLTPREGYKLLITDFTIQNKSKSKKEINLINLGITYQLDINADKSNKPLLTFLENDLQYVDLILSPGKSEKALLIFEVSKDIDLTNISLRVERENKSISIKVK